MTSLCGQCFLAKGEFCLCKLSGPRSGPILSDHAGADPGFLERGFICIKVCVCGGGGVA